MRNRFAQVDGLPFCDVLSTELLTRALQECAVTVVDTIYTPLVTLWTFLTQVISADQACRAAVARLIARRVRDGQPPCSPKTGAYCTARARLPEAFFRTLVRGTAAALQERSPEPWLWKGRDVKLFDGTTVTMPDTPENQRAYPQPPNQQPGLGFPIARVAAVFSLASGTVLDAAFCRFRGKGQSELGLLRQLWDGFSAGNVLLVDRYLCSWIEIALLQRRGVDVVARMHQGRKVDFRRGRRLGPGDHVVEWTKPPRPDWLDPETYAALPTTLRMREIRVIVATPGFRTRKLVVASTLLDATDVSHDDLAELYRARWHAELDLRSLKTAMQMDTLRGKSPDIVHKEIWLHLLAYNMIRTVMAQAALAYDLLPRTLSFKGALQTLEAFRFQLDTHHAIPESTIAALWDSIAAHRVGNRPGRIEPRARKRRPKAYPLLTQPRAAARAALL